MKNKPGRVIDRIPGLCLLLIGLGIDRGQEWFGDPYHFANDQGYVQCVSSFHDLNPDKKYKTGQFHVI